MPETPVSRWMTRKFLDWQSAEGSKKTVTDFAQYLGIGRVDASRYLSGASKPDGENLEKIGVILGFDIYDVLGRPRPDPKLQAVIANWGIVDDETKGAIGAIIDRALRRRAGKKVDAVVGDTERERPR